MLLRASTSIAIFGGMNQTAREQEEVSPLARAVDAIGGQAETARLLDVSPGLVWQWLNGRRPLPPDHCPAIERASGVRCEQLLPSETWIRHDDGEIKGRFVPAAA